MKYIILIISLTLSLFSASAAEVDSLKLEPKEAVAIECEESVVEEPDSLWDRANTAYINSDYKSAIKLYSDIEQQGLFSDKLYFNLGNAYYKTDDIARAILYYNKAQLISPTDADINYNLAVAQSQTKDQIEAIPEFFLSSWNRSVARIFDCTGWSVISLVALVLFFVALLLFMLSPFVKVRKIGFVVALFMAFICAMSTLYALGERHEQLDHDRAVIMSQSISIKSSPDSSATDLFMLHSGTTVKILREIDGWYEVVIADGKKGWIESKRVEVI